jgi:hypothetical protein
LSTLEAIPIVLAQLEINEASDAKATCFDASMVATQIAMIAHREIAAATGHPFASLRDALSLCRRSLTSCTVRYLRELNTANSVIRHSTGEPDEKFLAKLRSELSYANGSWNLPDVVGGAGPPSAPDLPCSEDLSFVGDWRTLPMDGWEQIHKLFDTELTDDAKVSHEPALLFGEHVQHLSPYNQWQSATVLGPGQDGRRGAIWLRLHTHVRGIMWPQETLRHAVLPDGSLLPDQF